MDKKELKVIEGTTKKLLSLLGVEAPFTVEEAGEGAEILLETEENGILIGYHGETLEALQLIISLSVAKQLGKFLRISVEVGEYKKKRMEYLKTLVEQTKNRVLAEGRGISLPNLKSWERRYVHMLAQEDGEITSESTGEGRDRVLTIYPKQ
ncbi:MAG TPA: R3H domain-containing nucleic acid-binding protein [Patescibacteria group bacterium]